MSRVPPPRSQRPLSESRVRQAIRYLRTDDRVCLAWAEAGRGPTLVKAANWMTHLELEGKSPVWRHWIDFFSSHFRFVRYDERGCGMSDWDTGDLGQGAARLRISDKTVRNHVSNLFGKLGVWTRAQAIVFARDRGFRSGPAGDG
jgi:pimeloyl-ACP methyl ester carboxylesterase